MCRKNMDGLTDNLDFEVWIAELEEDKRNEKACSIDNPDCESCSG